MHEKLGLCYALSMYVQRKSAMKRCEVTINCKIIFHQNSTTYKIEDCISTLILSNFSWLKWRPLQKNKLSFLMLKNRNISSFKWVTHLRWRDSEICWTLASFSSFQLWYSHFTGASWPLKTEQKWLNLCCWAYPAGQRCSQLFLELSSSCTWWQLWAIPC